MSSYHNPVLLNESVSHLITNKNGIYVDCTFGGGGHSKEILKRIEKGKLIAFDQDLDAKTNEIKDNRFELLQQNFKHLKNNLRFMKIEKVQGILADLGVSSYQFDTPKRGFSTRFESELDMRMNQNQKLTAQIVLNDYEENHLSDIFYHFGELRGAKKMAREIVHYRKNTPIKSVNHIKEIFSYIPKNKENKFLAQMFQAIRIEVNNELSALKDLLVQASEMLETGGRLVVISYHSLEDRLVKRFIRYGQFEGEPERDLYGNWSAPLKPLQSKVMVPTNKEIEQNPRARSAKLRVAIKN